MSTLFSLKYFLLEVLLNSFYNISVIYFESYDDASPLAFSGDTSRKFDYSWGFEAPSTFYYLSQVFWVSRRVFLLFYWSIISGLRLSGPGELVSWSKDVPNKNLSINQKIELKNINLN